MSTDVEPKAHEDAEPITSDKPAPLKIAPTWMRVVLGLFIAVGATLVSFLIQVQVFQGWFRSLFDRPDLGNFVIRVAVGVPVVDAVAFVGAFAVLVPSVFAVARARGRWPVLSGRWAIGAAFVTASGFAFAYAGVIQGALILMAIPTVAGVAAGVWILLQRANRDLARAYGTPEATRR